LFQLQHIGDCIHREYQFSVPLAGWIVIGNRLQRYLREGIRLRAFNYLMALLLLASLYPVVFGTLN